MFISIKFISEIADRLRRAQTDLRTRGFKNLEDIKITNINKKSGNQKRFLGAKFGEQIF